MNTTEDENDETDRSWRHPYVREQFTDGEPDGLWRNATGGSMPFDLARNMDLPGAMCWLIYGNIHRIAENSGTIGAGELLGYVITHEIGHLLLGPQHVPHTVMEGQWNAQDLKRMSARGLHFNSSQRAARNLAMTRIRKERDEIIIASLR